MLKLEIVTPERRVLQAEVDSVTVPTASGEATILPGHAPLVSALKPGVLTYAGRGLSGELAVSSGFLEVSSDRVSVLVDGAEAADEIDLGIARDALSEAEKAAASSGPITDEQAAAAREQLDHAAARLQVAGTLRRR